ncbi:MAG TPA: hypothetical protein VGO76_00040 [Luteibacter sp.]|jgi:hypothetical protein|nr:hypothetical protein [Luteibacter sp.]
MSIGNVVSKHRENSALAIVIMIFATMLLACAVLLITVRGNARPEGLEMVNHALIGCSVVGVLLFAAAFYIRRGVWLLGTEGVQGPSAREWPYREIAETCQFYRHGMPVGLAWRKTGSQEWGSVNAQLSGYRRFMDTLMQGYLQTRAPILIDELERGRTLEFKVIGAMGQLQKNFVLGIDTYLKVSTETIQLSQYALSFGNDEVRIADIVAMDVSAWTSRISFSLRDGTTKRLAYTALFDAQMLLALLEELVARKV